MKICIDAGHNYSGHDTGAVGNGLREQDITFRVADILKDYLHSVGIKVIMTRSNLDTNLGRSESDSLYERCRIANNSSCDLFVSIHCNSHPNKSANGTEVLVYKFGGEAEILAKMVQKNIVNSLGTTDRGVKEQNVAVLRETNMPAILVETAFVSNEKNAYLLKNNASDFARSIFWGICEYLKIDTQTKKENNESKELETVNDIVWELQHRGIITDSELWLEKLQNDINAYWLARKCVNYLRVNGT